ncbi:DOCK family protein [Tieghemostelium lacteum]|uniref:DOCK family protein n=1 Tax=Tieghemostelium lacteum TaxID=361077 RepID=A0A152A7L8_TIELA|nr:DOCK family protein [Tieghemostelium lacteum]|eukprot:KYR02196.1 DOCK family protein [Tieghemostelium lacteum]
MIQNEIYYNNCNKSSSPQYPISPPTSPLKELDTPTINIVYNNNNGIIGDKILFTPGHTRSRSSTISGSPNPKICDPMMTMINGTIMSGNNKSLNTRPISIDDSILQNIKLALEQQQQQLQNNNNSEGISTECLTPIESVTPIGSPIPHNSIQKRAITTQIIISTPTNTNGNKLVVGPQQLLLSPTPPTTPKVFSPPRRRNTCANLSNKLLAQSINSPQKQGGGNNSNLTPTRVPITSTPPRISLHPTYEPTIEYDQSLKLFRESGISNLNAEILVLIFQHLSVIDICTVGQTCKWWQIVSEQNVLWLKKFYENFQRPQSIIDRFSENESWKEIYIQHYFLDTSYLEVERLLQLFPLTIEYEHDLTILLQRVLNYLKHTECVNEYISKLEQLKSIHLLFGNKIEGALCFLKHSELITWDCDLHFPEEYGYPSESHYERKERLLRSAMTLLSEGKYWERSLLVLKQLRKKFKKDLQKQHSHGNTINSNPIIRKSQLVLKLVELSKLEQYYYQQVENGNRFFEEYFFVEFRGKGFPKSVEGKDFIFRGRELEKLGSFVSRLKARYPGAQVVPKKDPPPSTNNQSNCQLIHIHPCKPVYLPNNISILNHNNNIISIDRNRLPPSLNDIQHLKRSNFKNSQSYLNNNSRVFFYSIPFKKQFEIKSNNSDNNSSNSNENEFLNLWTRQTFVISNSSFPYLIRNSLVTRGDIIEIEKNPLENAIETLEKKNKELELIFYQTKQKKQWTNNLTMALNGVVDAAVSGGILMYKQFFQVSYLYESRNSLDLLRRLKQLLLTQKDLLEKGLDIHFHYCPENMKALQNKMELCFEKWKQIIDLLIIPEFKFKNTVIQQSLTIKSTQPLPTPTSVTPVQPSIVIIKQDEKENIPIEIIGGVNNSTGSANVQSSKSKESSPVTMSPKLIPPVTMSPKMETKKPMVPVILPTKLNQQPPVKKLPSPSKLKPVHVSPITKSIISKTYKNPTSIPFSISEPTSETPSPPIVPRLTIPKQNTNPISQYPIITQHTPTKSTSPTITSLSKSTTKPPLPMGFSSSSTTSSSTIKKTLPNSIKISTTPLKPKTTTIGATLSSPSGKLKTTSTISSNVNSTNLNRNDLQETLSLMIMEKKELSKSTTLKVTKPKERPTILEPRTPQGKSTTSKIESKTPTIARYPLPPPPLPATELKKSKPTSALTSTTPTSTTSSSKPISILKKPPIPTSTVVISSNNNSLLKSGAIGSSQSSFVPSSKVLPSDEGFPQVPKSKKRLSLTNSIKKVVQSSFVSSSSISTSTSTSSSITSSSNTSKITSTPPIKKISRSALNPLPISSSSSTFLMNKK